MKRAAAWTLGLLLAVVTVSPAHLRAREWSPDELSARMQSLHVRLRRLEAIKSIERLQYAYGYYQDRFLYEEVASLFARQTPEIHWLGSVWVGSRGVMRFWTGYARAVYAGGAAGPVAGRLFDLPQWQGVVTVAEDGKSAKGRFRTLGKFAVYRQREFWIAGVYENDYLLEDGVWKIQRMRFCSPWSAVYTEGWQNARASVTTPMWSPAATGASRRPARGGDRALW